MSCQTMRSWRVLLCAAGLWAGASGCGEEAPPPAGGLEAQDLEVLDQVPTAEEAEQRAAEEINAANLEEVLQQLERELEEP